MFNGIRQFFNRAAGAIAGLFTGFFAAFVYIGYQKPGGSFADIILFIPLIATIPYHMAIGAYVGATEGARAGLTYPKRVNQSWSNYTFNNELRSLCKKDEFKNKIEQSNNPPVLLSQDEEEKFLRLLESDSISEDNKKELKNNYIEYQKYINETKCTLSGKSLKEMEKPLMIDGNFYEASTFQNHVKFVTDDAKFHLIEAKPITIAGRVIVERNINNFEKNIKPFTLSTLPEKIAEFLNSVRKMFSSMSFLFRKLGVNQITVEPKKELSNNQLSLAQRKNSWPLSVISNQVKESGPKQDGPEVMGYKNSK